MMEIALIGGILAAWIAAAFSTVSSPSAGADAFGVCVGGGVGEAM